MFERNMLMKLPEIERKAEHHKELKINNTLYAIVHNCYSQTTVLT